MENVKSKKIKIGLFTHKNCDYDALCSTLSLAQTLNDLTTSDVEVIPVIEPSHLQPQLKSKIETFTQEQAATMPLDYAIVCDVNEQDRTYGLPLILNVPLERRFIIDHHDRNRVEIPSLVENRIIHPEYSATSEIVSQILQEHDYLPNKGVREDLYCGMAGDSACFTRSVSDHTMDMVDYLSLSPEEQKAIIETITSLTPLQQELFDSITIETCDIPNLKIYTLLEPAEKGDITPLVKHQKFDTYTGPNAEYPVTFFIIGCGNNYFIKMKKRPECPIDILSIALNCNGGGHSDRCSGRFYNTYYLNVLEKVLSEYHLALAASQIKNPSSDNKTLTKQN